MGKAKGAETAVAVHSQLQGGSATAGISLTESAKENCNKVLNVKLSLSPKERVSSAERIWHIGSQLGVSFWGIKDSIIRKIKDMEDRDQQEISISRGKNMPNEDRIYQY